MKSFFFYDLETSGLSAREDRIMQFAGQRTDMDLNPIGEPVNLLVKLADDTLPSPGAILVTKITPQETIKNGMTEAEFCNYVDDELFTDDTCILGYNSVRFDDEFMRHTFWRNFHDPYAWSWKNGRSRWDLLDVVRLTRALRPEGINWPTQEKKIKDKETGAEKTITVPTNRLELITKLNGIEHSHAHDALADVYALVEVTKLIKTKQPKLFDYLFEMRDKRKVAELVNLDHKRPFVYACGRFSNEFNKTTVAFPLTAGRNNNILVFDLRYNLDELLAKEKEESSAIIKNMLTTGSAGVDLEKPQTFYPIVKELCLNKCPAVAPLGVLEAENGWDKIGLTKDIIDNNLKSLLSHPEFAERMRTMYENRPEFPPAVDPESALYDGFLTDKDSTLCNAIRNADADRLADFHPEFSDERLPELLLHYKAKNYPKSLSADESEKWEEYRIARLSRQLPSFQKQMEDLQERLNSGQTTTESGQKIDEFILEELSLWYQNLSPSDY
ncbi:exodeoxyribonuclease I [Candidatus Saccharibacteria bacterium]|nr:exodeoxyribonuclease I [Candidatus Saccharibacteria bacterium]